MSKVSEDLISHSFINLFIKYKFTLALYADINSILIIKKRLNYIKYVLKTVLNI